MAFRNIAAQDAVVLTPSPIVSSLKAVPPADLPLPLLGASAVSTQTNSAVLTAQGSGVSVHDLDSGHCTFSFSVAPSVTFVCSSVLIPLQESVEVATTQTPIDSEKDSQEEAVDEDAVAEDDVAPKKTEVNGLLYAVVSNAPESGQKKQEGKRIWVWAVGEKAKKMSINGRTQAGGPGKPDWVKTAESTVCHIDAHGSLGLVVFHNTGLISVFKCDLTRPLATKKAAGSNGKVVWISTSTVRNTESGIVSERAVVVQEEDKYICKTVKIETKNGANGADAVHSIQSQERALEFGGSQPVRFCFGSEDKQLCVALSNGEVQIFCLKSNRVVGNIKLSHMQLSALATKDKITDLIPSSIAMQIIGKSYLAILALSDRKGHGLDILSIWDIRYGTMQFHKILNVEGDSSNASTDPTTLVAKEPLFGRCYNIEATSTPSSGPVLCITTSNLRSKPSKNLISFATSIALVPYYCPPASLMAAFGRLGGSLKFSLESGKAGNLPGLATVAQDPPPVTTLASWMTGLSKLEELDSAYVSKITASGLNSDSMALELLRWIWEKTQLLHTSGVMEKPKTEGTAASIVSAVNWEKLPVIEISQPAMIKILTHVLGNAKFYPVHVLQYLVRTKRVPASFQYSVKDSQGVESAQNMSVIDSVLARDDLKTLHLLLNTSCVGMEEANVLQVVKYICSVDADGKRLDERRAAIDAFVKSTLNGNKLLSEYKRCLTRVGNDPRPSSPKVFDGRRWFFEKLFAIPQQNDFVFARALRMLNIEELHVVVDWGVQLLEIDVRKKSEVARRKAALEKRKGTKQVYALVDEMQAADLEASSSESEIRRQLWWLWDTPGKKNEYADSICQAIDVMNLVIDAHLTTILLTPSLQDLVARLKACIDSDLHQFSLMERRLLGCLSVFELPTKTTSDKKQEVGQQLRQRWKRMVAQVNDGVGTYGGEVMSI
ncbi:hypothetical protein HDU77_007850 [Chytriomyces hyalinus]|nr:hypothetical protein HDU77_007850 [Chytriomyces hyalinus]